MEIICVKLISEPLGDRWLVPLLQTMANTGYTQNINMEWFVKVYL